jgi:uncharacterized NAD(P)/FAD-binding protein YdhS
MMWVFIRLCNVTIVGQFITYILHNYMFRSYDHHQAEIILLSRTTQLTTDPLFYTIANIIILVILANHIFSA